MRHFHYVDGRLHCEEVPIDQIAEQVGTPVYIYSERTLHRHVQVFREAFEPTPHVICYAVKANSNINILRKLAEWGTGFEIVSGGELFRAQRAGADPGKIIFSGVGKTEPEIQAALKAGILFFNVESAAELDLIDDTARKSGLRARVSIRANPDVDPKTHPYISTGMRQHKFGVAMPEARALYRRILQMPALEAVGVSCHIGSQITQLGPFEEALAGMRRFIGELREDGVSPRYLDFGGGLGIPYDAEEPPSPAAYAAVVKAASADLGLTLALEPGRVLVGNAGILLTRALFRKTQKDKRFLVVDAGMNDLLRPALYGSHHGLLAVTEQTRMETADVVGPVCESADFIAQNREIPHLESGDLLAIMSAGAYGFSLSSNYNSRPRAAEVLVSGSSWKVIRRRETYDDLIRQEIESI